MKTIKNKPSLLSATYSVRDYYVSINNVYLELFGKHLMLHYPYYMSDYESLEKRQENLTNYCLSHIEGLVNKSVLEVGCGNGIQSLYIADTMSPFKITGIDLNPDNVAIALQRKTGQKNVDFNIDDAQKLETISDNSIDVLICIESAFHYPNKELFLKQVRRVLKPTGEFVIADIVNISPKRKYLWQGWKTKMAFNHWNEADYIASFESSGLKIGYKENITNQIIRGYQGSSKWVKRDNFSSVINYLGYRLYAFVHTGYNTNMLKKKENYLLFVGNPVN
jgi:ubiquinone/menaquinone biosynthesis C-methylase UbiE